MEQQDRMAALFDSVADTYDAVGVDLFQPVADGLVSPRPDHPTYPAPVAWGATLRQV